MNAGAQVRLECRTFDTTPNVTFDKEGVTDETGTYSITVDGDHEDEICQVYAVKSPRSDCTEIGDYTDGPRVMLTKNNGAASPLRFANPIAYLKKEALPACGAVLRELGFVPLE